MKKILTILAVASSLATPFMYTSEFIKAEQNNIQNLNHLKVINKLDSDETVDYTDFIPPTQSISGTENVMYYGRVLKYYYANAVEISITDISNLKEKLTVLNDTNKALVIQNLIASTINISIYGSSSDAEFFAESFSKWLNTPDDKKNKSWEVTNYFFIKILPELLENGALLEDSQESIVKLITENIENAPKYDLTLSKVNENKITLGYKDEEDPLNFSKTYWNGNQGFNGALSYIKKQLSLQSITNTNDIYNIIDNWIYDSYTIADQAKINEFNNFNKNKYESFDDLDTLLAANSKDSDNVSRMPFKKVYDNLGEVYEKETPMESNDSEKWTSKDTQNLKDLTLFLYNMLSSLVNNESWVQNLLTGFIVSPDYPLESVDNENLTGVMGYTSTAGYKDDYQGKYASTAYSYIVLTGISLTYKEFNSQYTMGFWSSPEKYNVLIHEYGHALDAFGSKLNKYRSLTYKDDISYKQMYSGNIFGDYTPTKSSGISMSTWMIALIVIVGASVIIVVLNFTINSIRNKKRAQA